MQSLELVCMLREVGYNRWREDATSYVNTFGQDRQLARQTKLFCRSEARAEVALKKDGNMLSSQELITTCTRILPDLHNP